LRTELSSTEQRRRVALEQADALRGQVEASELRTRFASEQLEAASGGVRRAAEHQRMHAVSIAARGCQ
jgi:hypothetical protein